MLGAYALIGGALVGAVDLPQGGDDPAIRYLLRDWAVPHPPALALMGLVGIIAGVGHLLYAIAYRIAPVSVLAPFEYTALVFAGLLGYLIWGDVPDALTFLGAAILVASGLYVAHREALHRGRGEAL